MDVQSLLESRDDENPSGENLEYDPAFTDLEIAAQPGEERQAGDEILAAEDPDFREVTEKAMAVLERSHDLRAATFLASASLHTRGLPALAEVTAYMRGCLEEHWDTCHPQLDEEDDNDPTMRVNAVQALSDADTVLRALRLAPLTESRTFGKFSLRDIAVADGEISAPSDMENVPDGTAIGAAFQDTDPEMLAELLAAARSSAENVEAISAKFDEMVPGQGPDLDALSKMLRQIVTRLANATGVDEDAGAAEDAADADAGAPAAPSGGSVGGINSPTDVSNAIDRIIAYYERTEPSSPVPILLARAKRLVSADFMTIMRDMAPSGVDNVNLIGGLDDE